MPIQPGMHYLTTFFLFILQLATGGSQPADVHGTWTAELRNAEVFL